MPRELTHEPPNSINERENAACVMPFQNIADRTGNPGIVFNAEHVLRQERQASLEGFQVKSAQLDNHF